MKRRIVIKNIPYRLPFNDIILGLFLLHYFNVDRIYWGIFITLYSLILIGRIVDKFICIDIEIENDLSFFDKIKNKIEQIKKQQNKQ